MKAFIKQWWPFLLGAAMVAILFISGSFDSCSFRHTEAVIEAVDVASLRRHVIDSIEAENAAKRLAAIDSTKKSSDKTIAKLKRENRSLNDSLGNVMGHYETDTTVQTPTCDSIIDLFTKVVDNQAQQIRQDSIKSFALESEVAITRDLLDGCHTSLDVEKNNVSMLKTELGRQTTWWRRNEKWVYFGAGVSVPIILKALLR